MVVLNPNKKANMEAILAWCADNMEEVEVPTVFKIVTEISRDSSGHVDKLKLSQLFPDTDVICFADKKL